ncbi:MAG: sugar transporter permease [Acidobacteria bacterium]|nr:sugar transporter permease [Acidobacteriota bacterium]
MIELLLQSLPLALVASVPLLLAVEGELVVERGGILNLGIEGMMLVSAMAAVLAAQMAGSAAVGFLGGVAGALLVALLFGVFTIAVKADQIVTGTAVNLLALGITGFVYREMQQNAIFVRPIPHLGDSAQTTLVVTAWIVVPLLLALLLWTTSFGLRLRACGENPDAVTANGGSVAGHRWAALSIEALLIGIGGAYLSLGLSSGFAENMTAGRGFIALAIVIFGRWKLKGALLGTAVFGIAAAMQYALQARYGGVQFHLLLALPYVITLLILGGLVGKVRSPESLGK